jgi:putative transcriptional regulator
MKGKQRRQDMNLANPKNPALLVAMPQLDDPNFRKAVILVIDHTAEGAIGFIINRQSPLQLRGILAGNDFVVPENTPVWEGGPVLGTSGMILHNERMPGVDSEIAPGICLSSDRNLIQRYCDYYATPSTNAGCRYPYRFLVGYAGWGPGQLDAEIRMGAWIQASIDKEIIFDVPEENIWAACLKAIGIADANTLLITKSPFLN